MLSNTALVVLASAIGAQAISTVDMRPAITPGTVSGLNKCPYTEKYYTTQDGSIYAACPKTDYRGETYDVKYGYTSSDGCADLCNTTPGCKQVVYQPSAGACHLKNKDLNWVKDPNWTAVRFVSKPEIGSVITACPTPEKTNTIYGVTYKTCDNTDYEGETFTDGVGITSIDGCAALCAKTAGCRKSVFLKASSDCFLKASDKPQVWKYNLATTSSRTTNIPDNGSKLWNCPSPGYYSITSSSKKFSACINGDWQSNSLDIYVPVKSAQECADKCVARGSCAKASWDSSSNACHIKGASVFVFNQGFTSLQGFTYRLRAARAVFNL